MMGRKLKDLRVTVSYGEEVGVSREEVEEEVELGGELDWRGGRGTCEELEMEGRGGRAGAMGTNDVGVW